MLVFQLSYTPRRAALTCIASNEGVAPPAPLPCNGKQHILRGSKGAKQNAKCEETILCLGNNRFDMTQNIRNKCSTTDECDGSD